MKQPAGNDLRDPTSAEKLALLEGMIVIRRTEERLGVDSKAGKLPANVHLYIGQEAIAVGVCAHLADDDYITSTHRGHGHFLAKGGTPAQLIAEVYAKRSGACHGFGGSMHVADLSKGILGANGIVGGGIGIAAGAAFSAQATGRGQVAVAFFGDGAASEGVLSEVLNIAALWKLPLVLVCEHNMYAEFMPSSTITAGEIAERARPFGIAAESVDGNDVMAVWKAAQTAISRARQGLGTTLIEAKSYRLRGHIEAEAGFLPWKYRTDEEVAGWAARDPIPAFAAQLRARGLLSDEALAQLDAGILAQIAEGVKLADESAAPEAGLLWSLVTARGNAAGV
jgi:acetoin:2,6-dichlorophenolindophenol oxidoreductase subunit alpha